MAISLDAVSSKDAGNVSSSTLSHTCAADATMLIVCIGADSAVAPTGITYNGVSMTKEVEETVLDTTVWTLANPATGTNNIVVTFAANHYFGIVGMSLKGTATSTYIDGTNHGNGATNDAALSITTGTANSWLVGAGFHNRNSSRTAISGTTIQGDQYVVTDNFRVLGLTSPTTTAGAYNIGWTMGTPSDGWWFAAIGIKENAGGGGSTALPARSLNLLGVGI